MCPSWLRSSVKPCLFVSSLQEHLPRYCDIGLSCLITLPKFLLAITLVNTNLSSTLILRAIFLLIVEVFDAQLQNASM